LNQLINSTAPDKGVGLQLAIPIRNRAAQADQVRSQLEYRQAQMRLQQQENQIRIEVRNAQFSVQQNRASVEAARAASNWANSRSTRNRRNTPWALRRPRSFCKTIVISRSSIKPGGGQFRL